MKRIYEKFEELGEAFRDGEHWTHQLSKHTPDECFAWQHGVMEFAKWLDTAGVRIIANPEIDKKIWKDWRTHKPGKFCNCSKK